MQPNQDALQLCRIYRVARQRLDVLPWLPFLHERDQPDRDSSLTRAGLLCSFNYFHMPDVAVIDFHGRHLVQQYLLSGRWSVNKMP